MYSEVYSEMYGFIENPAVNFSMTSALLSIELKHLVLGLVFILKRFDR